MDEGRFMAPSLLLWLLACILAHCVSTVMGVEREYYIAAVITDWSYTNQPTYKSSDTVFKKIIYREYEAGFQKEKTASDQSGILGPTLRAEVGDKLKVNFKNMAYKPLTIHPQGIAYRKTSEGSKYSDKTFPKEKMDDVVLPGQTYTYNWDITEDIGPKESDPFCLTYTYYSHENMVQDFNSGLIGTLLICKKGSLNNDGTQKNFNKEYILMFAVFDESKSWKQSPLKEHGPIMYTINGYINGTMPDVQACVYDSVSWHLIGMSSKPELFSVHFFGQTLEQKNHKVSVISLIASASITANMTVTQKGKWLITSLIERHFEAGMHGYIDVQSCGDKELRVTKTSLYQKRFIKKWDFYIAAEEVLWDYITGKTETPDRTHYQHMYKKTIYREYTDHTFKTRASKSIEAGLLGPVIRAQVKDTIMVVFKNMASRPYSIYPQGMSIQKSFEGANYPPDLKGNETQNQAVMPGETMTYYWNVLETDEPTEKDPRCLTRIYHSAVNFTKDIASGLVGPLLICKTMSLNTRGVQLKADWEQIAMFTVFDENKSWYREENELKRNKVVTSDQIHIYQNNIINTINGYAIQKEPLGFCDSHVIQWHVSSVGAQDEILSLHLTGHTFRYKERSDDIVNIFPMSGESISVEMENQGLWFFGTLGFSTKNQGMKLRFRDVICRSDDEADDYTDVHFSFDSFEEELAKRSGAPDTDYSEEEMHEENKDTVDDYSDNLADLFHIRSLRNNTEKLEELQNLTALAIEHTYGRQNEQKNVSEDYEHFPFGNNNSSTDLDNMIEEVTNSLKGEDIVIEDGTNVTASDAYGQFNTTNLFKEQVPKYFNKEEKSQIMAEISNGTRDHHDGSVILEDNNIRSSESGHLNFTLLIHDASISEGKRNDSREAQISAEGGINITADNPNLGMNTSHLLEDTSTKQPHIEEKSQIMQDISNITKEHHDGLVILENNNSTDSDTEHHYFMQQNVETFMLEGGRNGSSDLDELKSIHINLTAGDLSTSELLEDNTPEQPNIEEKSQIKEQILNSRNESLDVQISTGDYNAMDSDNMFVEGPGDLNKVEKQLIHDSKERVEKLQSTVTSTNNPVASQSKKVVKRNITHTNDSSTNIKLVADYIPKNEMEGLGSLHNIINDSSNNSLRPENVTIPLTLSNDINQLQNGTPQPFTESDPPHFTNTYLGNNLTTTQRSELNSTEAKTEDYHDIEFKEMLGPLIFEDIMQAIFHQKQDSDMDSEKEQSMESTEDLTEGLQNQSSTFVSNKLNQEHLDKNTTENMDSNSKIKKLQVKRIRNSTLSTTPKIMIRQKKRVKNKNDKRSTFYNDGHMLHSSNDTNQISEFKKNVPSNSSRMNDSVNPGLSPRGFSPRGNKPQIIIGVSRPYEDDYVEYDTEELTRDEEEDFDIRYVEFEEPYQALTEEDVNRYTNPNRIIEHYLRSSKGKIRNYFIAAVEEQWDYSVPTKSLFSDERPSTETRSTQYKKVRFQQYIDVSFTKPDVLGEFEEHLGILGPVIRAEVDDVIQVTFKNLASRPYSLHAHGVSYEKSSEGLSYDDETKDWLHKDDSVKPGDSYVYVWYATKQSGPEPEGSACRTWAYYSGVNPEKDIHSGLLGPLLICRNGTLNKHSNRPLDAREFILLFMTFEEEKSWYFKDNVKKSDAMKCHSSDAMKCHTYHAINGKTYDLKGLKMYDNELVRWHMLNMGGPQDLHVVHFHGQTFTETINQDSQHGVYPLLPGSFATIEMKPSKAGLWLLDTEVAEYQQAGMQALFQIVEGECNLPMGLSTGTISDDQITASHYTDYWEPRLARLNNVGSYNAWSTEMNKTSIPFIQVDLLREFLISGIKTQGASKYFKQYYVTEFFIVYSKDMRKWIVFKGNSSSSHKLFDGNIDAFNIKDNQIDPPITARYVRVYPTKYYNRPTLRMELLGCEIQGCSMPLGMENSVIKDEQITASSYKSSWYSSSWTPSLARLNKQGKTNAWQAKSNNYQQWIQIDLLQTMRITAIATQGAKSLGTDMYVKSYSVQYSDNGKDWKAYIDQSTAMEKIFQGNVNGYGQVKNDFSPPIFTRFLRIVPKSWTQSITMRLEIFGCDT